MNFFHTYGKIKVPRLDQTEIQKLQSCGPLSSYLCKCVCAISFTGCQFNSFLSYRKFHADFSQVSPSPLSEVSFIAHLQTLSPLMSLAVSLVCALFPTPFLFELSQHFSLQGRLGGCLGKNCYMEVFATPAVL